MLDYAEGPPFHRKVIGYASTTGTLRNLQVLYEHGWRLLYSPGHRAPDKRFRYALDNGAWGCFQRGAKWDEEAFLKALQKYGQRADWIVAPDIVGGGLESLFRSLEWLSRIEHPLVLVAVQDGMEPEHVATHLSREVGLFLGGTTEWKESRMACWGELSRSTGCYYHVGRCNSARRIRKARLCGAHSFDGTSVTRYATTIGRLDAELSQGVLWGGGDEI